MAADREVANRLNRTGKELLQATSSAVAKGAVLERKWDEATAEAARKSLCSILKKFTSSELFWEDLAVAFEHALDPRIVHGLRNMDLDEFEDFEIRAFRSAGLDAELARRWTADSSRLLFITRLGYESAPLPDSLYPDIERAKAGVTEAHRQLCQLNPQLTDPDASPGGKKKWKRFWSATNVIGGLGIASTNGGLLLAGVVTGGVSAIFGGGTVIGGFWRLVDGARGLQEG